MQISFDWLSRIERFFPPARQPQLIDSLRLVKQIHNRTVHSEYIQVVEGHGLQHILDNLKKLEKDLREEILAAMNLIRDINLIRSRGTIVNPKVDEFHKFLHENQHSLMSFNSYLGKWSNWSRLLITLIENHLNFNSRVPETRIDPNMSLSQLIESLESLTKSPYKEARLEKETINEYRSAYEGLSLLVPVLGEIVNSISKIWNEEI